MTNTPKNIPTREQVEQSRTWTELSMVLGYSKGDTRGKNKIKAYVRKHFPDANLLRHERYKNHFTDNEFLEIVSRTISVSELIKSCGLVAAGAAYRTIHRRLKRLDANTDHFLGQAHARGRNLGPKRQIEEYLTNNSSISSTNLRDRLLREGIKQRSCEICDNIEWMGKPIPLHLDHIDGDHSNNLLGNLRVICPNCHAQTPTYCGKNIKRK
jgi:hypothetical protein